MAFFAEPLPEAVAALGTLERFTPTTVTSPTRLIAELVGTLAEGVAINLEERYAGVRGIAAPVLDRSGAAIYAIGIPGPVSETYRRPPRTFEAVDPRRRAPSRTAPDRRWLTHQLRRLRRWCFDRGPDGYSPVMTDRYTLPKLPYAVDALGPWCPAETLELHHGKHHATYVKEANAATEQLGEIDPQDAERLAGVRAALTFNLSGHVMHSLFWESLTPEVCKPTTEFEARIVSDFGSLDRFLALFTSACVKVQGSGWGALMVDTQTGSLRVGSILDHSNGVVPDSQLLAVIDVWEHAYYLTHKNDRASWVEAAIEHLDWEAIGQRCDVAVKSFEFSR